MSSLNKVMLIGRLGKDPESRKVGSNTVTKFSIATSKKWVKEGKDQEKTEWHNIVVWGKLAETCAKYLSKGKLVYLEGELQTTMYEKDGQKRYSTEVVANVAQFLSPKDEGSGQGGYGQAAPHFDSNEDLPF